MNPLNTMIATSNYQKVSYPCTQSVSACHVGHSHLCKHVCGVVPLLPSHCVMQISSLGKTGKGAKGERESLLKDLLHCTTSAAGRAQTHPSCQCETNEERLGTVHKPHPLQGRQRLTGWKSGHTEALNTC